MNYRKWMLGLLIIVLCLPIGSEWARAATVKITLELDGETLTSDVPPYITASNVTMVPINVISQGLGAVVQWNQSSKTVTITKDDTVLKLTSGMKSAFVNNVSVALDTSVQIKQGRVMVPIRFVSEQLGLQVVWNQAAKHISLYSGAEPPQAADPVVPNVPAVPVPTAPPVAPQPSTPPLPSVPGGSTGKEMKGVWISTVFNLDYPTTSSAGNVSKQKQEFDALLDKLKAVGFNAVFVQVRPSADSLYASKLVPWSKVLTGTQGKDPGYDPLEYMVSAAHSRGMELHAWFNPFRVTTDDKAATLASLASNNVAKAHPDWIVKAGGKLYLNPGIPEARQHIIDTVMEVVRGYEVDGVHLDDYFYPSNVSFADDAAYKAYNAKAIATKENWRRDNINEFVRQLGVQIRSAKPSVSYGISPFGVWRNIKMDSTGSDTAAGVTAYDSMYADVRTWIKEDWIDYVAPQIYWSLSFSAARYDKLVDWWVKEVEGTNVKLYIGLAAYKVGASDQSAEWQSAEQMINQLKYNEKYEKVAGSIMFRAGDIVNRNPFGLASQLTFYFHSGT
ncbi:family 10 glycosylhydrolase [Paenibacillus albidus]|uniref:family 10 glycosylhydrolase n=1 Tax=Paenibacillus albidus TaxID=2041023 RepID=UPI001BEC69BD|nr:family 10 glycosylhydrolase [Paenibacillus albidus]MBT2290660.1 family 10 glycosylhydrolase [Paenibacillus albidus]